MRIATTLGDLREALATMARPIGVVPTMGALHEGHAALIRAARAECATVVVSIYVNPRQFNVAADLDAYPRTLSADVKVAEANGAALLFAPSDDEMYPPGARIADADPGPLAKRLEGARRPGHFAGVATVVTRLFDLVEPDVAYFGEKDAQQVRVVEWIAAQRPATSRVQIRRVPTVRDHDGLALSSRNARLTQRGREVARAIPQALDEIERAAATEHQTVLQLRRAGERTLNSSGLQLEYLDFADPESLQPLDENDAVHDALVTVAAVVDGVRLLDERLLRRSQRG